VLLAGVASREISVEMCPQRVVRLSVRAVLCCAVLCAVTCDLLCCSFLVCFFQVSLESVERMDYSEFGEKAGWSDLEVILTYLFTHSVTFFRTYLLCYFPSFFLT
jgi:hypothetical protein